jgi:hypothetical protein
VDAAGDLAEFVQDAGELIAGLRHRRQQGGMLRRAVAGGTVVDTPRVVRSCYILRWLLSHTDGLTCENAAPRERTVAGLRTSDVQI